MFLLSVMENNYTERQIEIMNAATARIDQYGIQELTIKNLAQDVGLSEAALYRHFKGKKEIMLSLLDYFRVQMKGRVEGIISTSTSGPVDVLREIFTSQLNTFVANPAIVSIIFSEGIFQFNRELLEKVSEIMNVMETNIGAVVAKGQQLGVISSMLGSGANTTIIMGSMRLVVLKWKLSGHKSDLVKDGMAVLNGLLKMLEK